MKNSLDLARIWIFLTATFCAGSWALSFLKALTLGGYSVLLATQLGFLIWWGRHAGWGWKQTKIVFYKISRRWRKPLPLLFALTCVVSFLGGSFNEVSEAGARSYRIPRILHWLSENGWHWIHTADDRMNGVACNYEFLAAPFVLLNSDRFAFLISFSAYLILPGLLFSLLRSAGVAGKVAWCWSWIIGAGWTYAMQAGSFANDAFCAAPTVAAVLFVLRGVKYRRITDLWISILAIALLTGTKQSALPLVLVWAAPMLFGIGVLLRRPVATMGVCVVGFAASVAPITIANIHYLNNWKGLTPGVSGMELPNPFWGVIGNCINATVQNFQPPIFPMAAAWNGAMDRFVKTPIGEPFSHFEVFALLGRSPHEINAGLGFGVSCLLVITLLAAWWARQHRPLLNVRRDLLTGLVCWLPYVSLAAFFAKSPYSDTARYLASYYPLLFPAILGGSGMTAVIGRRWWQRAACASLLLTLGLLLISRQRPVFPASVLTKTLEKNFPNNPFAKKVVRSFSMFMQDDVLMTGLVKFIPAGEKRIGYAANKGNFEPVVWRSAPERKVYRFNPEDGVERARALGVTYIIVDASLFWGPVDRSIQTWLQRFPGDVVGEIPYLWRPEEPPLISYVVKLRP